MAKAKAKKPVPNKKPTKAKPAAKKRLPKPKKPAAKKKSAPKKSAAKPKRLTFKKLGAIPELAFEQLAAPGFEVVFDPAKLQLRPFAKPTRELLGHMAFVQALAFSPDGARLVTGSEDGTIRVWVVATGECETVANDHASAVNFVAFSTEGDLLSASDDYSIKRWTFPAMTCVQTFTGHTDYVSKVRAAGPGRAVSSSKDGTIRVWDFATGQSIRTIEHGGWVLALGASHDGRRAVACCDRNKMQMYDLETGAIERVFYDASAGYIGDVMGMTVAAQNRGLGHPSYPKVIVFAPDDRTVLSAEIQLIEWDVATGAELRKLDGDGWSVNGIAMIPDRATVLRDSSDPAERDFISQLETAPDTREVRTVYGDWLEDRGRLAEANSVRAHGAFRYVLGGSRGAVHVFDLALGAIVAQAAWQHEDLHNVAISPDGRTAACGSHDGPVALWEVDALLRAGMPDRHLSRPTELAISNEGIALTVSSDRTARLWRKDGTSSVRLPPTAGLFAKAGFVRDGSAVVLSDKGVLAAYAPTGEPRGTARISDEPDASYSFNERYQLPDGSLVVGATSGPLVIWPLEPVAAPTKFAADADFVTALAVDAATDLIATARYASQKEPLRIALWNLSTRTLIRELAWATGRTEYGTSITLVGELLAITTSAGGLLICDREGAVKHAIQIAADYVLEAQLLADGRLLVNGDGPTLVDAHQGRVIGRFAKADKQYYVLGNRWAVRYDQRVVERIDFAKRTVSAPTRLAILDVELSENAAFAVCSSPDKALEGVPIVLRGI